MAETYLKQAMSILFDMEKNNYLMTKAIMELEQKMRTEFVPPKEPERPYIGPEPSIHKINVKDCIATGTVGGGFVGGLATIIITAVYFGLIADGIGFTDSAEINAILIFLIWVLGAIAGAIIGSVQELMRENKKKKTSELKYTKYLDEKRAYETALSEHNANYRVKVSRSKQEYEKKKEALRALKAQLIGKLSSSQTNLAQFYNTIGIDVKFRNIVPIAYMTEFLNLGISTKLEGADGLYYLTMKELRMDQMQYKLDSIASKLDTIIDRQHSLYTELTAMNINSERLISASINQTDALLRQNALIGKQNAIAAEIEKNTAIAAYNSERTAKEAEYQSYLQRYNRW